MSFRTAAVHKFHQFFVCVIENEYAAGFYFSNENTELLQVVFKSGEDIDVIPRNARQHCNVWKQEMKLWPLFNSTCRVFIGFANDDRRIGNADRLVKAIEPCTQPGSQTFFGLFLTRA